MFNPQLVESSDVKVLLQSQKLYDFQMCKVRGPSSYIVQGPVVLVIEEKKPKPYYANSCLQN